MATCSSDLGAADWVSDCALCLHLPLHILQRVTFPSRPPSLSTQLLFGEGFYRKFSPISVAGVQRHCREGTLTQEMPAGEPRDFYATTTSVPCHRRGHPRASGGDFTLQQQGTAPLAALRTRPIGGS